MNKQSDQMKWVLFWVFLVLFVLMVLGTLAMVFLGFGSPTGNERELMVKGLIGEVAACIIALFYSIFGLKSGAAATNSEIADVKNRLNELTTQIESLGSNFNQTDTKAISGRSKPGNIEKNDVGSFSYNRTSDFDKALEDYKVAPPFLNDEYNLKPLPTDIKNDLRSAKPFDLKHRKESYLGMKVQWKVLFYSIHESDENNFRISADADPRMLSVVFNIEKSKGQNFKHFNKSTPFWVCGEIVRIDAADITLKDVFVKFED